MELQLEIGRALDIEGWMERSELEWLATQASKHKLIVEIGSYLGRSTRALADNTDGIVIAIDDWYGPRMDTDRKPNGKPFTSADRVGLFRQFSLNMSDLIKRGKVAPVKADCENLDYLKLSITPDMVFIDGDHCYHAVHRDISYWKPRMQPGGLICGHDSNYGDVARAVTELLGQVDYAPNSVIWYTYVP